MSPGLFRIGIDVGGTFTDLVAVDGEGAVTIAKSASTPKDLSIGVMDGLGKLAARMGLAIGELLARTERIVHGTTIATNALLERKGAKVGLITTQGHRDVLEMREGLKGDRYDLRLAPPEPLVPRRLRLGVTERLDADGTVRIPLDHASLEAALHVLKAAGVEAVAVCYLHAYRDPTHERATRAAIAAELPGVFVSLSSEVLPQIKEFERVSTTTVNAYVGPVVGRYLTNLTARLAAAGCKAPLFIILSHGGVAPVEEAVRLAAATALSGPAGGVAGARRAAVLLGIKDLLPFDMGGTSTDISLIANGTAALGGDRGLAGQRIALRSLDIISIGAGGGSIAHVDAGGTLHVGPGSAGADPGPACYGRGGEAATVTDANLVLGYLDASSVAMGERQLDIAAANAAIDRVARLLGVDRIAAASGIYRIINMRMAEGMRLMTVRRGVDPRRFALFSFGGAAGLHAVEVARQLEIPRVIVPRVASVLSAWGMLASELRYEVSRTHIGDTARLDDAHLRSTFAEMEAEAVRRLSDWFSGPIEVSRSAEMRYGEQIFEVDVSLDGVDWAGDELALELARRFHAAHEKLYTYASPDQEVVLVNARVAAIGEVPPIVERLETTSMAPAKPGTRRLHLDGWREVPVLQLQQLRLGEAIAGPALIEAEMTTVLIGASDRATLNALGWLDIAVKAGRAQPQA